MSATDVEELGVELVLDAHALVGEGPVWDDTSGTLVWVDIMRNAVHRYDPATGHDRATDVGQPLGAAALRRHGQSLVLALRDGFGLLDEGAGDAVVRGGGGGHDTRSAGQRSGPVEMVAAVEADVPTNRMNDGKCDPGGRFWAGTMAFEVTPGVAALYRLDPDLSVHQMVTGVTLSNGLDWSLDGRQMYYIDSPTQGVDVFDFNPADGSLGQRRRLITIPAADGLPDGMTVDAEGGLWVALHGSGTIRRYMPDGRVDRLIRVPATMVTSCAFGGPDLTDLYITTISLGLSEAGRRAQPLAGGLFRCRPGVRGRLPNRFAA